MRVNKILKHPNLVQQRINNSANTQVTGHIYYFEISKYSNNYKMDTSLGSLYKYAFFGSQAQ